MYKNLILIATIFILGGCVSKQTDISLPNRQNSSSISLVDKLNSLKSSNGVNVDIKMPNSIALGKFLNIEAIPNINGYLQLIVLNPYEKVETLLPSQYNSGFIRANSSLYTDHKKYGIKTFPPKGLHHILVLFSTKRTPKISSNPIELINKIRSGKYGKYFIDILPIDIY